MEENKRKIIRLFNEAKAVLFDLDGVIVDSDKLHDEAKIATLKHYHFKIEKTDWEEIKHYATSQIYQLLQKKNSNIKITEKEFVAYKSNYFSQFAFGKIELIPEALSFVKFLKKNETKTAIVTATRHKTINLFTKKFNLDRYFDIIITGNDVKNLKPDPEAYLKAIKILGLESKNCVVIEDTAIGVQSGKSAGCQVVGKITTVFGETLITAGADAIFKDFSYIRLK